MTKLSSDKLARMPSQYISALSLKNSCWGECAFDRADWHRGKQGEKDSFDWPIADVAVLLDRDPGGRCRPFSAPPRRCRTGLKLRKPS
jgi:hypothetical protein